MPSIACTTEGEKSTLTVEVYLWKVDQLTVVSGDIIEGELAVEWDGPTGMAVGTSSTRLSSIAHLASLLIFQCLSIGCRGFLKKLGRLMRCLGASSVP